MTAALVVLALPLLLGLGIVAWELHHLDTLIPPDLFTQDGGDGEPTPPWACEGGDECDCASCAPTELPQELVHVEAASDAEAVEALLRRAGDHA